MIAANMSSSVAFHSDVTKNALAGPQPLSFLTSWPSRFNHRCGVVFLSRAALHRWVINDSLCIFFCFGATRATASLRLASRLRSERTPGMSDTGTTFAARPVPSQIRGMVRISKGTLKRQVCGPARLARSHHRPVHSPFRWNRLHSSKVDPTPPKLDPVFSPKRRRQCGDWQR
jgi:hypothetical protein